MSDRPKEQTEFGKEWSQNNKSDSVECLGMTFENDDARREYFLNILREKLKDPEFRKIEGFPIGKDEDILALSDPPYYTACPNPFIEDFINLYGKSYDPNEKYSREPFATDVSEVKNDPIYNAHSYHTKVPHKAIMRYILHYTEPGDVVFDGFCGTGMTGVATQLCGDREAVESLGYRVLPDGTILDNEGKPFSKLGARYAILNDLSPAATFIAYNYNTPVDVHIFEQEARRILKEVEEECGWMYETMHSDGKTKGRINYTVWSDVYVCPECTNELIFWECTVDKETGQVKDEFPCPNCGVNLTKRNMERAWVTKFDKAINQTIRQTKQIPVLINYTVNGKRHEKTPDDFDYELIDKIEKSDIPYWFPTDPMMFKGEQWGDTWRAGIHAGITHVHHFYTKRNLWVLADFLGNTNSLYIRQHKFLHGSVLPKLTKMNRYMPQHGSRALVGPMANTLYFPSMCVENNALNQYDFQLKKIFKALDKERFSLISNHASERNIFRNNSIDYIFVDPPFGANIMYSELNFLSESWFKVITNNSLEAIENKTQDKSLADYQQLMTQCFLRFYDAIKPGHWMTVEFHNSKNSVWNAIQEALQIAGFVIADVRLLDKTRGGLQSMIAVNAVQQDLIISTYKPNSGLEERFKLEAGTEKGVWDFVRTHLKQLPVFVTKDDRVEIIVERQNFLLFDRMVAFHVQRGFTVPLSAADFYAGLAQRFPERDGMYFLPEQAVEYDKKRMKMGEDPIEPDLFVFDESSAIQWLRRQLFKKPQTFQEIHPQFLRELGGWNKNEKPLELMELLHQNFLRYDGNGEVPSQIHGYLSTNYKDLRNLPKDDPILRDKAKDRWYVPDINKASDLEKLREKSLLRDFEEYRDSKQKRLRIFRLEAVRAGFKKAWQERDYKTIIEVASKIPENVLQEDQKLLMWYDQAMTRAGSDKETDQKTLF